MERNEELREQFRETIDSYPPYKLYYVDEMGIEEHLYREYAWSDGIPIVEKVRGKKFKRTNAVAAKSIDKIIAPMVYDCSTDAVLFEYWFEYALLKSIPKYSIIIMDNASFHRKAKLRELSQKSDCEVLFLPPYSPDLNLIEKYWPLVKGKLRKILPQYDCFDKAFMDCF